MSIHDTPEGITVRRLAKDFLFRLRDCNQPDLSRKELVDIAREFALDVSSAIHGNLDYEDCLNG